MFEKLLSLLLHAKGGALATVLVIGASGALVTATVENGMTTVTITQPSTDGSTATTPGDSTTTTTTNPVILALFNRTKAEEDPTSTATGNGCSDAAHGTNEQVKRVDTAFKTDHAAVQALSKDAPKTDAAKKLVKDADNKIKGFRQVAVKAIHELFKSDECKGNDDEDNDEDNDENDDEDDDNGSTTGTTTGTTSTTTVAISGTNAKAIADAAIQAMDAEVTNLTTALDALKAAPATTNTSKTDKAKSDNKSTKNDNKGKGHSEGRSHDSEDDD